MSTVDAMSTRKRKSVAPPASADAVDQITAMVVERLRASGWTPPGANAARPVPMQTLVLRVPAVLLEALDKRGPNRSDTARAILASALGLKLDPPQTGPAAPKRR